MINTLFLKNGLVEYDSTYFTYNASGILTRITKLAKDGSAANYAEVERNEFTYSNGNLIVCKNFLANTLFLQQSVEYDNKTNPMAFGKDWMLVASTRNNRKFEQSSPNNATSISFNQSGTISTTNMSYSYNTHNLPATRTSSVATGTQTVVYYY